MATEKVELISNEFRDRIESIDMDVYPTLEAIGLDENFALLVSRRVKVTATIKALEEEKAGLDASIAAAMECVNSPSCTASGYKVSLSVGSRSTLDKVALIEHGVKKSIIEACTKVSKFVSLRMYEVKK